MGIFPGLGVHTFSKPLDRLQPDLRLGRRAAGSVSRMTEMRVPAKSLTQASHSGKSNS
jgi:hypothetical protein